MLLVYNTIVFIVGTADKLRIVDTTYSECYSLTTNIWSTEQSDEGRTSATNILSDFFLFQGHYLESRFHTTAYTRTIKTDIPHRNNVTFPVISCVVSLLSFFLCTFGNEVSGPRHTAPAFYYTK